MLLVLARRQVSAFVTANTNVQKAAVARLLVTEASPPAFRRPTKLRAEAGTGDGSSEHPLFAEVTALGDEIRALKATVSGFKGSPEFLDKVRLSC